MDFNAVVNSKYDNLYNKQNDTLANYANSVSLFKNNFKSLNYYRALAAVLPVLTKGDIFLNQMLGLSLLSKSELAGIKTANGTNGNCYAWLARFKADMKKYTAAGCVYTIKQGICICRYFG